MDLFMDWKPHNEKREETWATLAKMEKWVACRKACAWTPQIVGYAVYYLLAAVLPYYLLLGLVGPVLAKIKDIDPLVDAVPLVKELWVLELPWWGVLLSGFAGLFVVPLLLALVAKLLACILSHLLVREKKIPLPTDVIQREKAIHQRGSRLLKKFNESTPPLEGGVWMSYISVGITVAIPFVLAVCTPFIDQFTKAFDEPWIAYLVLFGEGLVAIAIPAFLCWLLFLWMSMLLTTLLDPLCEDGKFYKRREALTKPLPTLYKRWLDVDPEERKADARRAKDLQRMREKEEADKKALRMAMAGAYLREQKEYQQKMDDLHRWARGDYDDPSQWRGSGDGI